MPRSTLATRVLLACALAALTGPTNALAAPIELVGGVSDNYKAAWNADPSQPERRTWLSVDAIVAGGASWRPSTPGAVTVTDTFGQALVGPSGRRAQLTGRVHAGAVGMRVFRADPEDRWGPLLGLGTHAQLRAAPVQVELRVVEAGRLLGSGYVRYQYDSAIAGAPAAHIEHNGPGGRWWVGAEALPTDWESRTAGQRLTAPESLSAPAPAATATATATATSTADRAAPRVTTFRVPRFSRMRVIRVRIYARDDRRVTHLRVAIGARRYSRWIPWTSRVTVRLARGNARWRLRVQVRDSAGHRSRAVTRFVRCRCR